jgi:hypothetical protein
MNGDGAEDFVILLPGEVRVYLCGGPSRGQGRARAVEATYHRLASVELPEATGPLVVRDLTSDGWPDVLVGLADGGLQLVEATLEVAQ